MLMILFLSFIIIITIINQFIFFVFLRPGFFLFFCFVFFWFFEAGFLCVALAVLELTM